MIFYTFSVWSLETRRYTCLKVIGLYHCITILVILKKSNSLLQCLLRWQKDVQWAVMVMGNVSWEGANVNQDTEEMIVVKVRHESFHFYIDDYQSNDISKFSWYQSSYSILWGKMICARRRLDYTKISCCYLIKIQPNRNQKPVWMKILSNIRFNSLWSSRHVYLLNSKLFSYKILTLGMTLYLLYHYTIIVFHVNMQVVPWNMVNAFYKLWKIILKPYFTRSFNKNLS